MLLITLNKRPHETRVEVDGVDITAKLTHIDISAQMGTLITKVTLTLLDEVVIIGEPGRLEFVKRDA